MVQLLGMQLAADPVAALELCLCAKLVSVCVHLSEI